MLLDVYCDPKREYNCMGGFFVGSILFSSVRFVSVRFGSVRFRLG